MTRPAPLRLVAALLLPGLLAACATDGGGGGSGGDRERGGSSPRWTSSSRVDAPAGAPTLRTFPPETQAFMQEGLRQFSRQDPRWEGTRREWLALGDRESQFLVQTIWAALLGAQTSNAPDLVERARHELALIGTPSVPLMASVLSTGPVTTTRDAETGETRSVGVDDFQRREAAEVLSIIGAPAADATIEALGDAATKAGKRYALSALGNMGTRGGDRAARTLISYARDGDDVLRVEAVHGMRTYRDGATQSALAAALGDGEELVRLKAADALAERGDRSMVSAIRGAAARAQSQGKLAEARRMERAASALEKHGR